MFDQLLRGKNSNNYELMAAHLQIIYASQQLLVVPLSPQLQHRSAKQIKLHRHLGRHGGVDNGGQLVGGKDPQRVVPEVQDRDELVVADPLEPSERQVPLLFQRDVIARHHHRLRDKLSASSSLIDWLEKIFQPFLIKKIYNYINK